MLPLAVVEEALGRPATLDVAEESLGYDVVAGAGALSCMWWADNVDVLRVAVFPEDSVSEVDLPTVDQWRGDPACDWYCTVTTTLDGFVVVTTANVFDPASPLPHTPHAETVRLAGLVAPVAVANVSAAASPWVRDRTGWLQVDCAGLASRTSVELGRPLVGEEWSMYIDPPLTVGLIGDAAARYWVCRLVDPAGEYVEVWGYAGAAWGADIAQPSDVLPRPWTGQATEEGMRNDGTSGRGWSMTDGVNLVVLSGVPAGLGVSLEEMASAVATALTP